MGPVLSQLALSPTTLLKKIGTPTSLLTIATTACSNFFHLVAFSELSLFIDAAILILFPGAFTEINVSFTVNAVLCRR